MRKQFLILLIVPALIFTACKKDEDTPTPEPQIGELKLSINNLAPSDAGEQYEGWIVVNELFSDNLNEAQEVHRLYHHFRSATDRVLGISHNETFRKYEIIQMVEKSGVNIQLHFECVEDKNLISGPEDIELRIENMEAALERIKGYAEYQLLQPKIEEFREKASKYGFQPATRIVLIGEVH